MPSDLGTDGVFSGKNGLRLRSRSAIDQQFLRGKSSNNPSTNARTRRRG